MRDKLSDECEMLLGFLIGRYGFLQPGCKSFGEFTSDEAKDLADDLILHIKHSFEMNKAHNEYEWGK